jgi:hypothetical protein
VIIAGGLLATVLVLENATADGYNHARPLVTHGFAISSILISLVSPARALWSAAKQRRAHWRMAAIPVVIIIVMTGQPMMAALLAFLFVVVSAYLT